MPRFLPTLLLSIVLATLWPGAQARGQSPQDAHRQVRRWLDQGHVEQALAGADAWLAQHAADAQMRFLRTAALEGAGRADEAQAALERLIQDYPELPEPYNNLAVMYAAQGRLEEAQRALEEALRNHPQYATAWENLGQVHTRLAQRAWGRARALGADVAPGRIVNETAP